MIVVASKKEKEVPERVLALREKIHDAEYMDLAIQRIAVVLSRKIVEKPHGYKEAVNGSF